MPMSVADVNPIPFQLHGTLGESGRHVRIAILAEGFASATEHLRFRQVAREVTDFLIDEQPFREYLDRFVVVGIDCSSKESATRLERGTRRPYDDQTPFDVTFDFPGRPDRLPNDRVVVLRGLHWKQSAVRDVARAAYPNVDFDAMLVLVNSGEDGGRAEPMDKTACLTLNDPKPTFVHELGHALAGLGDEYEDEDSPSPKSFGSQSDPVEPNVTVKRRPEQIKWAEMLSLVDIPSTEPDAGGCTSDHAAKESDFKAIGVVGLFEGALGHSCDIFRPSFRCRMRKSADPFCPVCSDAIRQKLVGARLLAASSIGPVKSDGVWTHAIDVDGLYGRAAGDNAHIVMYSADSGEMALLETALIDGILTGWRVGRQGRIRKSTSQSIGGGWMTMTPFATGGQRYLLGTRFDTAVRAIFSVTPRNLLQNRDVFQTVWSGGDDDGPWTHVVAFQRDGKAYLLYYNFFNGQVALDEIVENMGVPEPHRLTSYNWMPVWNTIAVLDRAGAPHVAFINAILGTVHVMEPHRRDATGTVLSMVWPSKPGFLPMVPMHAAGITVAGQPLLVSYTPNRSVAIHSLRMGGSKVVLDFNQRRGLGFGAQMLLGAGAPAIGAFGKHIWFYGAATQEFRFLEFA